jgi:hypothetical protein
MQLDLFEFPPRKRCPRCRERKLLDEFPRNRSTRDGRQSYCKPCYNLVIHEHKDRKYGGHRNFLLGLRYGIDEATYDALYRRQSGKCAICISRKAKHVDHCHQTKRLRGLLCVNCNNGLGKFEDDIAVMQRAVRYLESPGPRVESP